jgi:hypothetical protein
MGVQSIGKRLEQEVAMHSSEGHKDIFISHASEDKQNAARPLYRALMRKSLAVWYDEFTLHLGDNLQEEVEQGLKASRFGVVILSPFFFAKQWPRRELEALLAREDLSGAKILLPIWHDVTHTEVFDYSPIVARRVAVSTSRGIGFVARKIAEEVTPGKTAAVPLSSRVRYAPPVSCLFTYGTAISFEQLSRYLQWSSTRTQAVFLNPRVGRLKGYKLTFSTPYGDAAPRRGASNIEYSPGEHLEGIVYEVGQEVLTKLEATVTAQYWLVGVEIELRNGAALRCQTFIAKTPKPGLKPHPRFIDYMVRASEAAGLSLEYIQSLREYELLPDAT